ncbi:16S rRNA (cytidine(1402)-2'-O)-methyltransferase [Candidatus Uhrbacteria bacterium CG10_big_fil_rev_8_21_14_0_10_48_11]|uniref:Ribosomal RNA small subunit methyltransferase I n=1 Tax=Candidatus Uhrbacteria bacterium CG10_big_fil_rev_8_21_14_0_10_48_11 TaxID=1975037 RepID=A0A2M8LDY2_9BACT|nr:MAG: 16S rRNA (cytidine(1402)-2'-O)-methyltransferase [Candidatus Uhrbacteria bacterium CG10_big_fil_rev_8_21_14_0_10_48_11]
MSTLFVVATPIGNLDDLTGRARFVLSTVPVVLAEDTRRTRILLQHIGANPTVISYHQHTVKQKRERLLEYLANGDVALVTDAGTPGISDPGGLFVAEAFARFGSTISITPIPGPSAMAAAASVCGFPMDSFLFLGYPPHKKGRKTFFDRVADSKDSVIFYEAPHRILKALVSLAERCPNRQLVICRELTKQFETIRRGAASEILAAAKEESPRGEYTVVVGPER